MAIGVFGFGSVANIRQMPASSLWGVCLPESTASAVLTLCNRRRSNLSFRGSNRESERPRGHNRRRQNGDPIAGCLPPFCPLTMLFCRMGFGRFRALQHIFAASAAWLAEIAAVSSAAAGASPSCQSDRSSQRKKGCARVFQIRVKNETRCWTPINTSAAAFGETRSALGFRLRPRLPSGSGSRPSFDCPRRRR
jgi:hypothetical protein